MGQNCPALKVMPLAILLRLNRFSFLLLLLRCIKDLQELGATRMAHGPAMTLLGFLWTGHFCSVIPGQM